MIRALDAAFKFAAKTFDDWRFDAVWLYEAVL